MVLLTGFAIPIAALAALVVTVITLVNRLERQAGSIRDHLTATGAASRAWPVLLGMGAPLRSG